MVRVFTTINSRVRARGPVDRDGLFRKHRDGIEYTLTTDERPLRRCRDVGASSSRLRSALRSHLSRIHVPRQRRGARPHEVRSRP